MKFDVDKDIGIFDKFFEKRPEVGRDSLKKDLERFYLGYLDRLIEIKKTRSKDDGIIVGVSAIQGAGKTTQGEILEILLKHFGFNSISLSIDDHYITHEELCILREKDPRFIRRGVTHDIELAISNLTQLKDMNKDGVVLVSGYDKGAHFGDGDRFRWVNLDQGVKLRVGVVNKELVVNKVREQTEALELRSITWRDVDVSVPEKMGGLIPLMEHFLPTDLIEFLQKNRDIEMTVQLDEEEVSFDADGMRVKALVNDLPKGFRLVTEKPDFIFYDGWMLGVKRIKDESIFNLSLPALESDEDKKFAKDVNKILDNYQDLWLLVEFMNVLYVPNYKMSLVWRDQAEESLRTKGEGMNHEEIKEFVYYFWRSVHPAIHIQALVFDTDLTDQVFVIDDDHSVKEVLTPEETKLKYP